MKKTLFITLTFILTFMITGCGETTITELPEEKQGVYLGTCPYSATPNTCNIYKFDGNTMKRRLCNLKANKDIAKSNCEFDDEDVTALYGTVTYNIKDLDFSMSDDGEDGSFNVYNSDGEKEYECNTSFGKIYCSTSTGGSFTLKKQS